jgi:sugar phosphate isomerase/epimerase
MKYSLFTVSVPEMHPEEALAKIKEFGYDGVDWRVTAIPTDPAILQEAPSYWRNNYCTYDIATIEQEAPKIRALTESYGIEINALATYLDCGEPIEKIEACMRAAKAMGCGRIRVNSLRYDPEVGYTALYANAVAGFERVERAAKKYGVKADFEMHMGTITPAASGAFRLASNFDPRYIGVIYDSGNAVYEGFEEYRMAFEILGPYLDLVHIKNAQWKKTLVDGKEKYQPTWAPFMDGYADFDRCFAALHAVGYDGYVTFEDFSSELSSEEKLRQDIAFIRAIAEKQG